MDITSTPSLTTACGHVQALHELGEPGFEVQAVVQDEVGFGGLADVAGGGFVAVDLGAGLGDGLDRELVPGNVPGDVGQHGEGGQHHGLVAAVGATCPSHRRTRQGTGTRGRRRRAPAARNAADLRARVRAATLAHRNRKLGIPNILRDAELAPQCDARLPSHGTRSRQPGWQPDKRPQAGGRRDHSNARN